MHRKWNKFATSPKHSAVKDWGMCKGSQLSDLVLSGPTKLLNYRWTWNESKETNFRQIIKPLSFMTQSQWKLPCLHVPSSGKEKKKDRHRKQKEDNGARTSLWLQWDQCSCASLVFGKAWALYHTWAWLSAN